MFKPGRIWRSDKNRVKAVFMLQFHVTQVPELNLEALSVSVVPADVGKPTARLEKGVVREGTCRWESPIYEMVKFTRDAKTRKIGRRIYRFLVISSGSAKSGYVGEVSVDFADYASTTKGSTASLPLKNSKCNGFLHISIQRLQETVEHEEIGDKEHANGKFTDSVENTLNRNDELDNGITSHPNVDEQRVSTIQTMELIRRASSGSDMTMSSSRSSSDHGTNTDESSHSTLTVERPEEASGIEVEKLREDIIFLSRQMDRSELELQTLRKQIAKESKKVQDLSNELTCSKEERDALRAECEKYRLVQSHMEEAKRKNKFLFESGDSRAILEEFRQELRYEKEVNGDLRVQLQKTNESNADLILAIKELEEMLDSKGREAPDPSGSENGDDEEQKALEEIVREHRDSKETYVLEQTITDLRSEIETCRRGKDELEMQMEQLALDHEIVMQENHDLSIQLEQSRLQEQLKMQDECCSESLAEINELQARVKELEEEMGVRSKGFEADLEAATHKKVEQEQRAIRAEDALRKTRWKNACTAENMQEQLKKLCVQMSSTFNANEKVALNALAEASVLCIQNSRYEVMLKKSEERLRSVKDNYEAQLLELSEQLNVKADQISKLKAELDQLMVENRILSERAEQVENIRDDLEFLKQSLKQSEAMVDNANADRVQLLDTITLLKKEAEKSIAELNQMKSSKSQEDSTLEAFRSEVEALKCQCDDLKTSLFENEAEKEKLKAQIFQLKGDIEKEDDAYTSIEKKLKESIKRTALSDGLKSPLKNHKPVPVPRGSKGPINLKEKVKSLEAQIKSKDASANSFSAKTSSVNNGDNLVDGAAEELEWLRERTRAMEGELKEMQERYSETSLKFAEVEGERQQLVMTLRNLENCKKR